MSWFPRYPFQAEESGGGEAGTGGVDSTASAAGEGSPAGQEPALSPLHWAAGLSPERQALPIVRDAKNLDAFVQSADETKRFVGDSIRPPKGYDPLKGPGEGVDVAPMYRKLGMPEKPSDYVFDYGTPPEGVTFKLNPAEQDAFRAVAHKAGLAPWQVNLLTEFERQRLVNARNREAGEVATLQAQGTAQLYEMHGANTPTVQAHARNLYTLMGQGPFGTPELTDEIMALIEEKHLDKHPKWVTGMANFNTQMQGGRFLNGDQPIEGVQSLPEINAELAILNAKVYDNTASQVERAKRQELYDLKTRLSAA